VLDPPLTFDNVTPHYDLAPISRALRSSPFHVPGRFYSLILPISETRNLGSTHVRSIVHNRCDPMVLLSPLRTWDFAFHEVGGLITSLLPIPKLTIFLGPYLRPTLSFRSTAMIISRTWVSRSSLSYALPRVKYRALISGYNDYWSTCSDLIVQI
jgi:hypothetical protein